MSLPDRAPVRGTADAHQQFLHQIGAMGRRLHASLTLANDLEGSHTPPFLLWAAADSMVACALNLLALAERGRRLEAAPDVSVQAAFRAGLVRWCDAAEAVIFGVRNNDPSELLRAARALESGSREFQRMGEPGGGPAGQSVLGARDRGGFSLVGRAEANGQSSS